MPDEDNKANTNEVITGAAVPGATLELPLDIPLASLGVAIPFSPPGTWFDMQGPHTT